jgi:hypothetical protein
VAPDAVPVTGKATATKASAAKTKPKPDASELAAKPVRKSSKKADPS